MLPHYKALCIVTLAGGDDRGIQAHKALLVSVGVYNVTDADLKVYKTATVSVWQHSIISCIL